jgi:hypothetical protein
MPSAISAIAQQPVGTLVADGQMLRYYKVANKGIETGCPFLIGCLL